MSTKTFKIGEYGSHPKYKINTFKNEFSISAYNWDGDLAIVKHYSYDALSNFEMDMMDETTPYYTDTMIEWIKSRKEYEAPKQDPFTTYTFSN